MIRREFRVLKAWNYEIHRGKYGLRLEELTGARHSTQAWKDPQILLNIYSFKLRWKAGAVNVNSIMVRLGTIKKLIEFMVNSSVIPGSRYMKQLSQSSTSSVFLVQIATMKEFTTAPLPFQKSLCWECCDVKWFFYRFPCRLLQSKHIYTALFKSCRWCNWLKMSIAHADF